MPIEPPRHRVGDDHLHSSLHRRLDQLGLDQGVAPAGIAAENQHEVRPSDLVKTRTRARLIKDLPDPFHEGPGATDRSHIDVWTLENLARERLEEIAVLTAQAAATDSHQRATSGGSAETVRGQSQRFLPTRLDERSVLPDQRRREAIGARHDIETEPPLDAEFAAIVRTLGSRGDLLQSTLVAVHRHLATAGAERTGGPDPTSLPRRNRRNIRLRDQGTHRTCVDTLTTEFAVEGPIEEGPDPGVDPTPDKGQGRDALNLLAEPNAATADDAFPGIADDHGRRLVARRGLEIERQKIVGKPNLVDQILETAISVAFANRALHPVIEGQELELLLPGLDHRRAGGFDDHPILNARRTCRHQDPRIRRPARPHRAGTPRKA